MIDPSHGYVHFLTRINEKWLGKGFTDVAHKEKINKLNSEARSKYERKFLGKPVLLSLQLGKREMKRSTFARWNPISSRKFRFSKPLIQFNSPGINLGLMDAETYRLMAKILLSIHRNLF